MDSATIHGWKCSRGGRFGQLPRKLPKTRGHEVQNYALPSGFCTTQQRLPAPIFRLVAESSPRLATSNLRSFSLDRPGAIVPLILPCGTTNKKLVDKRVIHFLFTWIGQQV